MFRQIVQGEFFLFVSTEPNACKTSSIAYDNLDDAFSDSIDIIIFITRHTSVTL